MLVTSRTVDAVTGLWRTLIRLTGRHQRRGGDCYIVFGRQHPHALEACHRFYAANARLFDWRGLPRLQLNFAHQTVYPSWLAAFVNEDHFQAIQFTPNRLLVALTRPARALGMAGSVAAGTLAYLVDKKSVSQHSPSPATFSGFETDVLRAARLQNGARSPNHPSGCCSCAPFHVWRPTARRMGF